MTFRCFPVNKMDCCKRLCKTLNDPDHVLCSFRFFHEIHVTSLHDHNRIRL